VQVIERAGLGPTVVCIHGFCQSSTYWAPTLDLLAEKGVSALAPDLPGFAGSAKEAGPYTMPALADAVAALLDRRGLKQVVLVGGSMGGVVAQHFVLRHPQRVLRLLLVATGAATADPAGALAKADIMAAAPWNSETVTPIVAGFFYNAPPPDKLAEYRAIAMATAQPAAVEAARSNASLRTLEELGRISAPTLIVQGRHDKARTPEHGAQMCALLPHGALEVIEDAGHTPQLERPEQFHAVALPFLLAR
jgi:pimeloyl-ACP methyl ester carboxylesterase